MFITDRYKYSTDQSWNPKLINGLLLSTGPCYNANSLISFRKQTEHRVPKNTQIQNNIRLSGNYNSYIYINLTSRKTILLEELTVAQEFKNFPTFHGTKRFIAILKNIQLLSILNQINAVSTLTFYSSKIHFSSILTSTCMSNQMVSSFQPLPLKFCPCFPSLPHMPHAVSINVTHEQHCTRSILSS
jgi:hypothetical protein